VAATSITLAVLLHRGAAMSTLGATMFVMGAGMGLANTALLIAVQESASWEERGVATASTMFFRTIGGAVAVGALGAVLAAGLGDQVPTALLNQLLGPEHGRGLDTALLEQLSGLLQGSLRHVFDVIAALSLASLAAGMAFPERRLAPPDSSRAERAATGG
jgi:MFS family permease